MQTIFYVPASGSISSSLTVVPENSSIITSVQVYNGSTLEITASAYESSGDLISTVGDLRIYIKSGSFIQASFPADSTTIFYSIYTNI